MKISCVLVLCAVAAFARNSVSNTVTSERWITGTPRFRSTNMETVSVDAEQTASAKFGTGDKALDEELFKLSAAITQIKGDIMRKSSDVRSEADWVGQVKTITTKFRQKVEKVKTHIDIKKQSLKDLLKKKRQMENLLLQTRLEAKLSEAKEDLSSLTTALSTVAMKKDNFAKNQAEVEATVAAINAQIATLKGGAAPAALPAK